MARKSANDEPSSPDLTPEEKAELDARLARMVTPPHRSEAGANGYFLLWTQRDENDSAQVMRWHPETPEELRGASLFYDAAHHLGAFAKKVAQGKPVRRSAEEAAFIKAILANRSDETGYLAYADYLTEQGNTQGDFIRLCVELEHLKPGDPGYDEKNTRQQELVEAHAEEWYAALGELGVRPEFYNRFMPWIWLSTARGVIEEVVIDRPGLLPDSAERLFAAAPFLRKLEFQKGQIDPDLGRVKHLQQIEELDFSYAELEAPTLRKILKSKHLTGLKILALNGNDFGDEGVTALAAWPGLAQLEALEIASCSIGSAGVQALARSPHGANLRRMRLSSNTLDADAMRAVLGSTHLSELTTLDIGNAQIDTTTVTGFRSARFASKLRQLDLNSATFERGAFAAFAKSPLPALESLNLNSVSFRAPEAQQLRDAPFTETLTALWLDCTRMGPGGAEALFAGTFPKLATLDLSRNRLATRGGLALARAATSFPALTVLKLWDNQLGPDAVAALAGSKILANLTELELNGNKIGPAGAQALAQSRHLTNLKTLTVDEKTVGKKGRQALLDRFGEEVVSWR